MSFHAAQMISLPFEIYKKYILHAVMKILIFNTNWNNTLRPESSLAQVMTRYLLGTKPLLDPMLTNFQLDTQVLHLNSIKIFIF